MSRQDGLDATALLGCAETSFRVDRGARVESTRVRPETFTAFDATRTADPGGYRVRRVGPFEYVATVAPVPRVLDTVLADRLYRAVGGLLPLYVEGSQSPLSVKPTCAASDLDVLLVVEAAEDLVLARKLLDALFAMQDDIAVPLSPGVVHAEWLGLPNFYSALSLDPASPDRAWWIASPERCQGEAARRLREGLELLRDAPYVRGLLDRSLAVLGDDGSGVTEWRITPRWWGYA